MDDAKALAEAGCFAIVLEGIPDVVAQLVTESVAVPTIGIGAGPHCDGQVLVFHDLLGIEDRRPPKFVRRYASLRSRCALPVSPWAADVRSGVSPRRGDLPPDRDHGALAEPDSPSRGAATGAHSTPGRRASPTVSAVRDKLRPWTCAGLADTPARHVGHGGDACTGPGSPRSSTMTCLSTQDPAPDGPEPRAAGRVHREVVSR